MWEDWRKESKCEKIEEKESKCDDAELKVESPKKKKKPNMWLLHTKKIREHNPELTYKQVLILAKKSYKKS